MAIVGPIDSVRMDERSARVELFYIALSGVVIFLNCPVPYLAEETVLEIIFLAVCQSACQYKSAGRVNLI